uniref:Uncharacterized protein n=1 Tax=Pipistrellus kuhlii TaxID=59472 RepID=A0A7J7YWW7_PIPKU|nr:hypothetical protein mPipKuh1_009813 [Pipistrellus kuhlii]
MLIHLLGSHPPAHTAITLAELSVQRALGPARERERERERESERAEEPGTVRAAPEAWEGTALRAAWLELRPFKAALLLPSKFPSRNPASTNAFRCGRAEHSRLYMDMNLCAYGETMGVGGGGGERSKTGHRHS